MVVWHHAGRPLPAAAWFPLLTTWGINALREHNALIERGFAEHERCEAATLYEQAFGAKLGVGIKSAEQRIHLLSDGFELDHAFVARKGQAEHGHSVVQPANKIIALAGFSTQTGALTAGITYRKILRQLGFFKGQKAAFVLSLFERKAKPNELLMDGIVVDEHHRGQGVGTKLFAALIEFAADEGYHSIRLDVIDTNPGAKVLYERLGFVAERTNTFEVLRPWLGFGASTTMLYKLT